MPTAAEPHFLWHAALFLLLLLALLFVPGWLIRRQARAVTEAA
jgi:ABC-type phosphate transport system permease subunit